MTSAAPSDLVSDTPLPGPLEPSETRYFRSRDGQRLYGEIFIPRSQPRGALLVMHGYAEHCGRYREVANVLVDAGFSVVSYDMRGHGRSDGQRGYVSKYLDYLDDMEAALAVLDEVAGTTLPRGLIAHSNGALVAMRALADPWRCPKRLQLAVISSPYLGLKLKVSPVKTLTARVASLAMPSLTLPNELRVEHLTGDPAKQNERRLDTLCHDVASARWFTEASNTQEWVLEFAHRVQVPSLWLVGGHDQIADPIRAREVSRRLTSESEYHEIDGAQHEVFNEIGRGATFGLLVDALDRHFPLSE